MLPRHHVDPRGRGRRRHRDGPDAAEQVAREAHDLGITRVWMHRSMGKGSVSPDAADYCRTNGMMAIAGGCPLMYGPTSDTGHRQMRWFIGLMGGIPKNA